MASRREEVGSRVIALRIGKAPKLWVGFSVTAKGLRRVVVAKTRAEAAKEVGGVRCGDKRLETMLAGLTKRFEGYAGGWRGAFEGVKVDFGGMSAFREKVLKYLMGIGLGEVRTYGEVASRVGQPGAGRAVGRVVSMNSMPIVIPCHRVVGAGGRLGGFSMVGGKSLKKALLEHEGISRPWR